VHASSFTASVLSRADVAELNAIASSLSRVSERPQHARDERDETGPRTREDADVRGSTILVVDDEPLARQMFTDLLEAQGFNVISVARGEEAFGFLQEVELVLLDAMLPGRDGWAICKLIRARLRGRAISTLNSFPSVAFGPGSSGMIRSASRIASSTSLVISTTVRLSRDHISTISSCSLARVSASSAESGSSSSNISGLPASARATATR
jgi:CheY-like chemotaxis protein